jgi:tripartite-type tricarboxylate transporter receptor subunit TctC
MTGIRSLACAVVLCCVAVLGIPHRALADNFPNHPFTLAITSSAGSGVARWGQMIAQILSKPGFLGQPVNVVYKGGGSGNEAGVYTHEHKADGYTLLQVSGSQPGYYNLPTMRYPFSDFTFVARMEKTLYAIGVANDSQFKTFKDLVAYAKANPGKLSFGGNKIGSVHQRMFAALTGALGVNIRYVPYQGTGQVVKDVLGHHVPVGMAQPGLWLPNVEAGKARMLLLLNDERIKQFPDLPVPSDLGIDVDLPIQFQAIVVKKGVPEDRIKFIAAALHKVQDTPQYQQYIKLNPGETPFFSDDQQALNADMRKQIESAHKFMVEHGILKK